MNGYDLLEYFSYVWIAMYVIKLVLTLSNGAVLCRYLSERCRKPFLYFYLTFIFRTFIIAFFVWPWLLYMERWSYFTTYTNQEMEYYGAMMVDEDAEG